MATLREPPALAPQGVGGPLGGFLERFRGSGGVPAAVGGELASELEPLFAELDAIEREASELRSRAEGEREGAADRLEGELASIAADARRRAELARSEAFATAMRSAEAEARAIVDAGEAEAAAILATGRGRLPELVEEVISRVEGDGR